MSVNFVFSTYILARKRNIINKVFVIQLFVQYSKNILRFFAIFEKIIRSMSGDRNGPSKFVTTNCWWCDGLLLFCKKLLHVILCKILRYISLVFFL